MKTAILIPAYQPDEKLIELVKRLTELYNPSILVINDGSGPEYDSVFKELNRFMNCKVVHHKVNKGKGGALKTGFRRLLQDNPKIEGCITVDADGQHLPIDIKNVGEIFSRNPDMLVLGSRDFSAEEIPFKSRMGNVITRNIYWFVSGRKLADTQTGLRGIPKSLMEKSLDLEGERYELEMNMLIYAGRNGVGIKEVPIETVYISDNASSHFRPVMDSFKIYKEILKFVLASGSSFVLDISLFTVFLAVFSNMNISWALFGSVASARLLSSIFNFYMNKKFVFGNEGNLGTQLVKYYILCGLIMLTSWALLEWLSAYEVVNIVALKVMIDICLFIASYMIQKTIVFRKVFYHENTV